MKVGDTVAIIDDVYAEYKEGFIRRGFLKNEFIVTDVLTRAVGLKGIGYWPKHKLRSSDPLDTLKLSEQEKTLLKNLNGEYEFKFKPRPKGY